MTRKNGNGKRIFCPIADVFVHSRFFFFYDGFKANMKEYTC